MFADFHETFSSFTWNRILWLSNWVNDGEETEEHIPRREMRWGIYLNVGDVLGNLGLQQPGRVHKARRADVVGAVCVVTKHVYILCGLFYNAVSV
jgi:hypothetical protein